MGARRAEITRERVVFRIGGSSFGIDPQCVREVAKVTAVLPCTRGASPVCGLVKVRGRAVPVYDIASLLGCKRSGLTSKSRLIVAEGDYGTLAFVVDAVNRPSKNPQPVYGKALVQMGPASEPTVDLGKALSQAHVI